MWLMWIFAVVIPIGVIHAIVTGEISTGRYATSLLRFEEKPVGFLVLIAALCLLELFLLAVLLRSRRGERQREATDR